jgi:hypothetical protein
LAVLSATRGVNPQTPLWSMAVRGRLFQADLGETGRAAFRRVGRSGLAGRVSWGAGAARLIVVQFGFGPLDAVIPLSLVALAS